MNKVPSKETDFLPTILLGEDCGYLDPIYTVGGQGTMIVVWEEPPDINVFFPSPGSWVEGTPEMALDGGCHADDPKALTDEVLAEWEDEGWIRSVAGFRSGLKKLFKRGPR